jgi:hypothetical protein
MLPAESLKEVMMDGFFCLSTFREAGLQKSSNLPWYLYV